MMRTSSFFLLWEDTANKKPDQECKAPPMVASSWQGFFFSVVGNQEEKRKSVMSYSIFLSCTHKKIERGVCFQYNVFCIEARIEFFERKGWQSCSHIVTLATDRQVNSALFSILSIRNRTHRLPSYKGGSLCVFLCRNFMKNKECVIYAKKSTVYIF